MSNPTTDVDIVIVDDDQFQLKLLSHQLAMVGHENVVVFDNGQTALNHMDGKALVNSIIILDINMSKMDGVEFLRKLYESDFVGGLLLVSSKGERILQAAETLAKSYKLNVMGLLRKPVQQEQLQRYFNALTADRKKFNSDAKPQKYTPKRLQQALDGNELFNVYQPKVLLSTGELIGVEALARWQHPEDGNVYPNHFVELAEENGMIDKIARLVLRNALRDGNVWKKIGINITIAVNISMYNLNTREFVSFLESELTASGISPQNLILELTETRLMRDYALVLDMLTRLRLRRVNLSIDNFGTGHSSMAQLRDIPFNELKIDKGFVHSACDDPTLLGIFDGSLQLAKNLGIKTVAEGVEDEADWSFLWKSGCDLAQGYFIGKPMRANELEGWAKQWELRYQKIAV